MNTKFDGKTSKFCSCVANSVPQARGGFDALAAAVIAAVRAAPAAAQYSDNRSPSPQSVWTERRKGRKRDLPERREDQGAVLHHHPQPVEVSGDDLILLEPLDVDPVVPHGRAVEPQPRRVGEHGLAGRLAQPAGTLQGSVVLAATAAATGAAVHGVAADAAEGLLGVLGGILEPEKTLIARKKQEEQEEKRRVCNEKCVCGGKNRYFFFLSWGREAKMRLPFFVSLFFGGNEGSVKKKAFFLVVDPRPSSIWTRSQFITAVAAAEQEMLENFRFTLPFFYFTLFWVANFFLHAECANFPRFFFLNDAAKLSFSPRPSFSALCVASVVLLFRPFSPVFWFLFYFFFFWFLSQRS